MSISWSGLNSQQTYQMNKKCLQVTEKESTKNIIVFLFDLLIIFREITFETLKLVMQRNAFIVCGLLAKGASQCIKLVYVTKAEACQSDYVEKKIRAYYDNSSALENLYKFKPV